RIEWERELLLLPARAGDALGARNEAQLPQQLTTRHPEAVAGSGDDQRLEPVPRELRALGQATNACEAPAPLAFLDDRLRLFLGDPIHVVHADAHRAVLDRAFGG